MSKKDPEVAVQSALSKYKKRMKKVCVCGTIWAIVGILAIVIGILFLVYFSKYWGNDENWKRNLAYAGVGLLVVGLVFIIIGVIFVIILVVLYKRISAGQTHTFKPPTYEYGKAPYPQQPPWEGQPNPGAPLAPEGNAPMQPSAPTDDSNVHVEISNSVKF